MAHTSNDFFGHPTNAAPLPQRPRQTTAQRPSVGGLTAAGGSGAGLSSPVSSPQVFGPISPPSGSPTPTPVTTPPGGSTPPVNIFSPIAQQPIPNQQATRTTPSAIDAQRQRTEMAELERQRLDAQRRPAAPLSPAAQQNLEQRNFTRDFNRASTVRDTEIRDRNEQDAIARQRAIFDLEQQQRFQREGEANQRGFITGEREGTQQFQTGEREGSFASQQRQDINRTGLQTGFRQNIIDQLPGILGGVNEGGFGPFPVGGPGGGGPFPVSGLGGGGTGGTGTPGDPLTSSLGSEVIVPGPTTTLPPPAGGGTATDRARAAASGRAQERIGLATQGALRGLEGALTSRGLAGPIEGAAVGNVLSQGLGQRGEFERDQALAEQARQDAIDDRNFAGNLAIRTGRQSSLGPILGLLQGGGANLF